MMKARTKSFFPIVVFALALLLSRCGEVSECGGTETGNPACPSTAGDGGGTIGGTDTTDEDSAEAGSDNNVTALYEGDAVLSYPESSLVVDNAEDFEELWEELFASDSAQAEIPDVDFDSSWVIAVVMGERSSGGYSVEITGFAETESALVVAVTSTSPGAFCFVTDSLTNPSHVVSVPLPENPEAEVAFEFTETTVECE